VDSECKAGMEYKAKTADVGDAGDGVEQLSLGFRNRPGHGSSSSSVSWLGVSFGLPLINHLLIWSHPLIQRAAIFSRSCSSTGLLGGLHAFLLMIEEPNSSFTCLLHLLTLSSDG
jgi:hypothetical protein